MYRICIIWNFDHLCFIIFYIYIDIYIYHMFVALDIIHYIFFSYSKCPYVAWRHNITQHIEHNNMCVISLFKNMSRAELLIIITYYTHFCKLVFGKNLNTLKIIFCLFCKELFPLSNMKCKKIRNLQKYVIKRIFHDL